MPEGYIFFVFRYRIKNATVNAEDTAQASGGEF